MGNPGRSKQGVIDYRRRLVARLVLRGYGVREIYRELADGDSDYHYHNPKSDKPWALGTISQDVTAIEDEWRDAKEADIEEHKARQLAELREHRRLAWRLGELNEIRLGIGKEMELLGTKAPERSELTGADGGPIEIDDAREAIQRKLNRIRANRDAADVPGQSDG